MPVMNGIEALSFIRQEEEGRGSLTPLIALTADAMKGTEEKMLQAGFDAYLTKPIKMSVLGELLQRLTDARIGELEQ